MAIGGQPDAELRRDDVPSWPRVLATTISLFVQRGLLRRSQSRRGRRPPVTDQAASARAAPISRRALVILVILVSVAGAVIARVVLLSGQRPARTADPGRGDGTVAAVAARRQAANWVAAQVSHAAVVGCDPGMCSELRADGFPAGHLRVLRAPPGRSPSPSGRSPSPAVVAVTPLVRRQLGRRLVSGYAPQVLAAFGTGAVRVEIRVVAQGGSARYQAALRADAATRRLAGSELAGNGNLMLTAVARRQLRAGLPGSRLMAVLAALAHRRRVEVLAFSDSGPGASRWAPLRAAELALPGSGARARSYAHWLMSFLRSQRAPYRASVRRLTAAGRPVISIAFTAPEPLTMAMP